MVFLARKIPRPPISRSSADSVAWESLFSTDRREAMINERDQDAEKGFLDLYTHGGGADI